MVRTLGMAALAAVALMASAAPARPPLPRDTPLRVVVLPVSTPGERTPSRAALERTMRRARGWYARASYGRLRLEYAIAPPVARRSLGADLGRSAMRRAAARGVPTAGAIPVLIEASKRPTRSFGSPGLVQIRGVSWGSVYTVVHELGHALGLDHAVAPTVCRRPFRPLDCALRPRLNFEYGDTFDVMGRGADRFGAYHLAVLGLAPVRDATPGRSVTLVRPIERRRPTLLRLRAAGRDWFVERRVRAGTRGERSVAAPAGVTLSRVPARYTAKGDGFARPQRIPATDPRRPCRAGSRGCYARQTFAPGRTFTVPGTFRLRVRRGGHVATAWLDRTPPRLTLADGWIERPAGAPPQLTLDVRAAATGAGVKRVEVVQDGRMARVDPDPIRGLLTHGSGSVRVPLGAGPGAQVRLVDAAGNASAPVDVQLATLPVRPAATVTFDPPLGDSPPTATPLAAGQAVRISGRTDAALAGAFVDVESVDTAEQIALEVAPDGTFAMTWAPPEPGLYALRLRVPVARAANGSDYVTQVVERHLRG